MRLQNKLKPKGYADGITTFITGMARGVDLWAGEVVLKLRMEGLPVRLVCASPYPEVAERWSERWKKLYHETLEESDAIAFIIPAYNRLCYQQRNEWMVDRSSRLIAVYNGSAGGTRNTIEYAQKQGCEVVM